MTFESFLQTPEPPKEVNKQTNRKCTGAKPLCPEGFKNSCTCTKPSPACSEEHSEGSSPSLQTLQCAVATRDAAQMLLQLVGSTGKRQQTQDACVGGGYQEHRGCLPQKRSRGWSRHRDTRVPKSVGAESLHRKTEKDLQWDRAVPEAPGDHTKNRSRISPGSVTALVLKQLECRLEAPPHLRWGNRTDRAHSGTIR